MKKKSIYLLSAIVIALFVAGGGPYHEAFANGLTLTSPNGGEVWSGGRIEEVEWVAPPEMVSFKLKYSTNNGKKWKPIASGISGRRYDWTAPTQDDSKTKCLVKVIGHNNRGKKLGADRSDAPFTILGETETRIMELESRVANLEHALESVLKMAPYLSVHTGYINGVAGPHVILTGVNLHVRSGYGSTNDNITGRGNLIVGYNEELSGLGAGERGGSHNLVIGSKNRFSSYGGLVVGSNNTISSAYASVSGGAYNKASYYNSSVSGGYNNEASGEYSTVSGGLSNEASGNSATVSGGWNNLASGNNSSVTGGSSNEASGTYSSVSGGWGRTAPGTYDWTAGTLWENH